MAIDPSGGHLVPPVITRLRLDIHPAPPGMPEIAWTASDAKRVTLRNGVPWEHVMHFPGDSYNAPAPPSNRINALPGAQTGFSWISATIGAPVNERISIPAYAYRSIAVGCRFGFRPSASFERGPARAPRGSDIYVTGPGAPSQPQLFGAYCPAAFAGASKDYVLHVPYGGAMFPPDQFAGVRSADWHRVFTSAAATARGGIISKTRDGHIVKIQYAGDGAAHGAYAIAPRGGEFPDVLALRNKRTVVTPLRPARTPLAFSAHIVYQDPIASTSGPVQSIFAETPPQPEAWSGILEPEVRVSVSPQPYTPSNVAVTWMLDGTPIAQQTLARPCERHLADGRTVPSAERIARA